MLELNIGKYGDIFNLPQNGEAVCVTTNGIVKQDGCAVMGAGIALTANNRFNLAPKLGRYITQYGNRAFNLGYYQIPASNGGMIVFTIFSFPTKHHYKDNSDVTLICKSAEQLVEMCTKFGITRCYLTRPGCYCGKLNWETTVKPWLSQILDDRFIVVNRE
jgi:hypothetical protein